MKRNRLLPALVVLVTSARSSAHVPACDNVKSQLMVIDAAIRMYAALHDGKGPPAEGWFDTLTHDHLLDADMQRADPWGHPYHYALHGPGDYELSSAGRDGRLGTGDDQVRAHEWAWTSCGDPPSFLGCQISE